jgi:membrane associated rhomboid family serine protease
MFPIGDENRGERLRPLVNYGLIALNFLVFFYELALSDSELTTFIYRWGTIPAEVSHGHRLVTLVTSQFIHAGWLHILGNMLFLWVFGDNIEDTMGHIGYLIFYILCGIAAASLQVFVNSGSHTPEVGASGAISGVLAAYLVLFPRGNIRTLILLGWIPLIFLIPAWVIIGYWIVLQFINGFLSLGVRTQEGSGVAYFAHVGGFVAGLVLVNLFKHEDAHQRQLAAREGTRAFQRVGWNRG